MIWHSSVVRSLFAVMLTVVLTYNGVLAQNKIRLPMIENSPKPAVQGLGQRHLFMPAIADAPKQKAQ